jgi:hypothetical protein
MKNTETTLDLNLLKHSFTQEPYIPATDNDIQLTVKVFLNLLKKNQLTKEQIINHLEKSFKKLSIFDIKYDKEDFINNLIESNNYYLIKDVLSYLDIRRLQSENRPILFNNAVLNICFHKNCIQSFQAIAPYSNSNEKEFESFITDSFTFNKKDWITLFQQKIGKAKFMNIIEGVIFGTEIYLLTTISNHNFDLLALKKSGFDIFDSRLEQKPLFKLFATPKIYCTMTRVGIPAYKKGIFGRHYNYDTLIIDKVISHPSVNLTQTLPDSHIKLGDLIIKCINAINEENPNLTSKNMISYIESKIMVQNMNQPTLQKQPILKF